MLGFLAGGAFDNERKVMPFTIFDNRVDRISINPRKQAFEKVRRSFASPRHGPRR